jgi:hypothetical protein
MPSLTWRAGRTVLRILSVSPLPTGLVRLIRTFLQNFPAPAAATPPNHYHALTPPT